MKVVTEKRKKLRIPAEPHHARTIPRTCFSKILVPIDFTDCSQRALYFAVCLAQHHRARLILLHVAETGVPQGNSGRLAPLEKDLQRSGRKQLSNVRRREVPAGMRVQSIVRAGRSDSEILHVAKASKADLIVMATHSRDSQQGQLGLTVERVARVADCPVLLVPVPDHRVPFFL